jgi:hypothetical protein
MEYKISVCAGNGKLKMNPDLIGEMLSPTISELSPVTELNQENAFNIYPCIAQTFLLTAAGVSLIIEF